MVFFCAPAAEELLPVDARIWLDCNWARSKSWRIFSQ